MTDFKALFVMSLKSREGIYTSQSEQHDLIDKIRDKCLADTSNYEEHGTVRIKREKLDQGEWMVISYVDDNLLYVLIIVGGLPAALGSFGGIVKKFQKNWEVTGFRYSEAVRKSMFDPMLFEILNNDSLHDPLFRIGGTLSLQRDTLPEFIGIESKVMRVDGKPILVPIVIDWGIDASPPLRGKAALALSGPDFERDREYIFIVKDLDEIPVIIDACRKTGRRRRVTEEPSFWARNIRLIFTQPIAAEELSIIGKVPGIQSSGNQLFTTPASAPTLLPDRVAPSVHRSKLSFFSYSQNELVERLI